MLLAGRAIVLSFAMFLASMGVAESATQCLSQPERRQAVRSGKVVRPGVVRRAAPGDLLSLKLCVRGGRLVYFATVIRPNGAIRTLVFDAASGAPMGN
jgi:hypothetical protein